jgi:hypothetical protein
MQCSQRASDGVQKKKKKKKKRERDIYIYEQPRERISERGRNPLEKSNLSERRKLSYLV